MKKGLAVKADGIAQSDDGHCLRWPDTFTRGPNGTVYVTTSHIQESAFFKPVTPPALPSQGWKLVGEQF